MGSAARDELGSTVVLQYCTVLPVYFCQNRSDFYWCQSPAAEICCTVIVLLIQFVDDVEAGKIMLSPLFKKKKTQQPLCDLCVCVSCGQLTKQLSLVKNTF